MSLLDRLDEVCANLDPRTDDKAFRDGVLEGFFLSEEEDAILEPGPQHEMAVAMGLLLQRQRQPLHPERKTLNAAGGKGRVVEPVYPPFEKGGAEEMWLNIVSRTDEIYYVHEHMAEIFQQVVEKLVIECAREDDEAKMMVNDIQWAELKDPVRLHEKSLDDQYANRFKDEEVPEAVISDVTRARLSLRTGTQVKELIQRIDAGIQLGEEGLEPIKPSMRAQAEADAEAAALPGGAGVPATVTEIKMMNIVNHFEDLDPTHYRKATCVIKIMHKRMAIYCELEVGFTLTLTRWASP